MRRAFDTLLVANRGEIAVRIFRTAKAMGLRTVAVYSDADEGALHTLMADEAVRIGPAPASKSYLDIAAVLDAAKRTGAGAIHPGYGFLSENAAFAAAVEEAGLVFIGPPPAAIEAMGDKAKAKARMIDAGVPVVPGWQGDDQRLSHLEAQAQAIGFPLLVKAAAGGGGRGMRAVHRAEYFYREAEAAKREALSAFGDDAVLLEKLISRGRHVEIQVLADDHGRTISLGERDCSAQRRRQKVIEEAPSPAVDEDLRERMGADAVAAAEAVGYRGAGTVEFLLGEDGAYYFLEMNTRLQVEHPVTEAVTGIDLVKAQIDIAKGLPACAALSAQQAIAARPGGHAIEVRLYAEDPAQGFAPQSGKILYFDAESPSGALRVDAGLASGHQITPYYDPMVAKLIAHGRDREEAIAGLLRLLEARPLFGLTTNRRLLARLLDGEAFRQAEVTTADLDFWAEEGSGPFAEEAVPFEAFAVAALLLGATGERGLRSASVTSFDLELTAHGETRTLRVLQDGPGAVTARDGGESLSLRLRGWDGPALAYEADGHSRRALALEADGQLHLSLGTRSFVIAEPSPWREASKADPALLRAPVSGTVVALHAAPGRKVEAGEVLAVMEAMKMEMRLQAEAAGMVASVHVEEGAQAASGALLITLDLGTEG